MKIQSWKTWLPAFDRRSLVLFRQAIAVLVLYDLAVRMVGFLEFYVDTGFYPRTISAVQSARFSLYLTAGEWYLVAIIFGIHAFFAVQFFRGVAVRWMAFGLYVLGLSIQFRNEPVLSGADVLLRLLLCWTVLLPLDEKQRTDPTRTNGTYYFGPDTLGFALQAFSLYFFAAIIKMDVPEWKAGQGVAYALWTESFGNSLGAFLRDLPPSVLQYLNDQTIFVEGVFPFLIFVPILGRRTEIVRLITAIGFIAFHASFLIFLDIGIFPLVGAIVWIPFLPSMFWKGVERVSLFKKLIPPLAPDQNALPPPSLPRRRILDAAAVFFFISCALWNLRGISVIKSEFNPAFRSAVFALGWDQYWNMFSRPISEVEWFVMIAGYADGTVKNAFSSGIQDHWRSKPEMISSIYTTDRHRKYFLSLQAQGKDMERMAWARAVCRSDENLRAFLLIRYYKTILKGATGFSNDTHRTVLWSHECRTGEMNKFLESFANAERDRS